MDESAMAGQGFHNYQRSPAPTSFTARCTSISATPPWMRGVLREFCAVDRQNEFGGNLGDPSREQDLLQQLQRLLLQHVVTPNLITFHRWSSGNFPPARRDHDPNL
jgi:hypothetical protein